MAGVHAPTFHLVHPASKSTLGCPVTSQSRNKESSVYQNIHAINSGWGRQFTGVKEQPFGLGSEFLGQHASLVSKVKVHGDLETKTAIGYTLADVMTVVTTRGNRTGRQTRIPVTVGAIHGES